MLDFFINSGTASNWRKATIIPLAPCKTFLFVYWCKGVPRRKDWLNIFMTKLQLTAGESHPGMVRPTCSTTRNYLYCHFSPEGLSHGCLVSSGFRIVVLRHWHTSESPRGLVKTQTARPRGSARVGLEICISNKFLEANAADLGTTLWEPLPWKKSPTLTFKISLTYQALEKNLTLANNLGLDSVQQGWRMSRPLAVGGPRSHLGWSCQGIMGKLLSVWPYIAG